MARGWLRRWPGLEIGCSGSLSKTARQSSAPWRMPPVKPGCRVRGLDFLLPEGSRKDKQEHECWGCQCA